MARFRRPHIGPSQVVYEFAHREDHEGAQPDVKRVQQEAEYGEGDGVQHRLLRRRHHVETEGDFVLVVSEVHEIRELLRY